MRMTYLKAIGIALVCCLAVATNAVADSAPQGQPAPATTPPAEPPATTTTAEAAAPAPAKTPPDAEKKPATPTEPFAFADYSWVPGNAGASERPLTWGPFTGEVRVDVAYNYSFNRPKDDTISGSSEWFRHNEFQLTDLAFGGDFLYKNVQARIMAQFGLYSETNPRNDVSPSRGQWNLADAYRYLSEAYAGYHIDVLHGINVQAGIFMSYIGLWSYYNFDNWTYQPSYVSSNTPWFFNGMRVQIFPTDTLKIEPWIINGWQSYGEYNEAPGVGMQIEWRPHVGWFALVGNQYTGTDTLGLARRKRFHTDDSFMFKYLDKPELGLDKAAFSLTTDAGCESGDGVKCSNQYFLGFMAYNRFWFYHDYFGFTFGGGAITNPGRYIVLLPPINGATAISGTPYFTENPGNKYMAWDTQVAFDIMPRPFVTFRLEYNYRAASVPYFTGRGGVTPPGGNQGAPGSLVPGWSPDLVKTEARVGGAMMVKF
jgi:hypothetical protein